MTRYLNAKSGRERRRAPEGYVIRASGGQPEKLPILPPVKEDRMCCTAKRDDLGRLPIGWCGPRCEGRPAEWALILRRAFG